MVQSNPWMGSGVTLLRLVAESTTKTSTPKGSGVTLLRLAAESTTKTSTPNTEMGGWHQAFPQGECHAKSTRVTTWTGSVSTSQRWVHIRRLELRQFVYTMRLDITDNSDFFQCVGHLLRRDLTTIRSNHSIVVFAFVSAFVCFLVVVFFCLGCYCFWFYICCCVFCCPLFSLFLSF